MKTALLIAILMAGCKESKPVKPFYIIGKYNRDFTQNARYDMADKNDYRFTVIEARDKWNIGDSIK